VIAYLDTATFDHIYKKIGCTGADIANLRKAIYGRELSIRLSVHTLEEILLGRKVRPQALAAQIKLTLSLASSRMLVKSCAQLLFDDIRAYALRGEADRPFLRGDIQNDVADGIAALIESDGEELEEGFVALLHQTREDKQHFLKVLENARQEAEAVSRPHSGWTTFQEYFDAAGLRALDTLAEQSGTAEACRERGFEGLRDIKSIRMSLYAALAPAFEQTNTAATTSSAIHHAVSAAAVAEIYVSEVAANRELLNRLPIPGLDVFSLPDFLKRP
jgi:hypothetical protein